MGEICRMGTFGMFESVIGCETVFASSLFFSFCFILFFFCFLVFAWAIWHGE
jgi:hypothetical protein